MDSYLILFLRRQRFIKHFWGAFLSSSPLAKIPTDSSTITQVCMCFLGYKQPATATTEKLPSSI